MSKDDMILSDLLKVISAVFRSYLWFISNSYQSSWKY